MVPITIFLDEEGDTHTVYELPAPKRWVFHHYPEGHDLVQLITHLVRKVRVCITAVGGVNEPVGVVIPFNEAGQEDSDGTMVLPGVVYIVGVLDQLGFAPLLDLN